MTGQERHFSVGNVVAGRYHILDVLGEGGAGEVYRAFDGEWFKDVALKVPLKAAKKIGRIEEALLNEIQMAQEVAHENVCQVYDIQQADESVLLKMQFIEGRTLGQALELRRILKLDRTNQLRMAREICAGLEAIHKKSVIHCDLKPSNVMIDDYGHVFITDFGIATTSKTLFGKGGTPGYMSPEQREGGCVSPASDVFSLGAVLYELFTGERAYHDDRSRDRLPAQLESKERLEHRIRAVIRACLDEDPSKRPTPAQVAKRLPEEALSRDIPVLVDNLLEEPELSRQARWKVWGALGAAAIGLGTVAALSMHTEITGALSGGEPPVVLEARARGLLEDLGFDDDAAVHQRSGFTYTPAHFDHVVATDPSIDRWQRAASAPSPAAVFWYRQSPSPLVPRNLVRIAPLPEDPPLTVPGMVGVRLDPSGRLVRLDAVPDVEKARDRLPGGVDWGGVLRAAGLSPDRMRRSEPAWIPSIFADELAAWEGPGPAPGGPDVRVEAAAYGGRVVAFRFIDTWSAHDDGPAAVVQIVPARFVHVFAVFLIGVLIASAELTQRHLRQDVADRGAAIRLALTVFSMVLVVSLLIGSKLPATAGLNALLLAVASSLLAGILLWLIYGAMEPFVRRTWPERTASWIRLLYGRFRDPLVGRDLLAGGGFAVLWVLWAQLYAAVPGWLGQPPPRPDALGSLVGWSGQSLLDVQLQALRGFRQALAMEILALVWGILAAFFAVVVVVLVRKATIKYPWTGRAVALLILAAVGFPAAGHPALDALAALGSAALWIAVLIRFGFLAAATMSALGALLTSHPLTFDFGAWHAPGSNLALLIALGIMTWGAFHAARAARQDEDAMSDPRAETDGSASAAAA